MPITGCMPWKATSSISSEDHEAKKRARKARHISKDIERKLYEAHKSELSCLKLLLLGTGESGKSTILKQMKIIHIDGYADDEKNEYIPNIKRNVRDAIIAVVAAMDTLKIDYENPENLSKSKYLIEKSLAEDYDYPTEFYDMVLDLWKDAGVRECFTRSNEYQLIDSAKYFLDKVEDIRQSDYIPSLQDILRCRKMTNAINEINFEIKDGRTRVKFKVFDVGGQQGERKKWIQLFDGVTAILFLADCSSFDMTLRENRAKNRLVDAFEVFQRAWLNKYLQSVPILVFINKIDILEDKLRSGRTLDPLIDSILSWDEYHRSESMEQSGIDPASPKSPNNNQKLTSNGSVEFRTSLLSNSKRPISRQSRCSTVMSILADLPYSEFQPSDSDQKDFLYSYPMDHYGRTANSMKGGRSRELPHVLPETIRLACYIKRVFVELTKYRVVADDGLPRKRKCHFYYTCAVNTDNVQKVLEGCRAFLMEEHLERFGIL